MSMSLHIDCQEVDSAACSMDHAARLVTWDPEQQLWRAAILTENGNERPAGWFKSSDEANTFLQFLSSSQNSNNNQQQQQQQLPRQETIAMQPMYENKMKHLEHELVLSNNNNIDRNNSNGISSSLTFVNPNHQGQQQQPPQQPYIHNIDNKLQQVRFGNTNNTYASIENNNGSSNYNSINQYSQYNNNYYNNNENNNMKKNKKNKRQYAKSKMVEHTPVLPEWYRTTHAMKVLNLSRADVSLASDVPGNILSRFLNGNSHLPTHLDRLKNWLNHLNSNNVMTEQESIEMAKVKKLTALDIVPKTVRKRKRRSRRNIGRVGIQESFRQRQQVGLTRTQEQEEQILLRQQRDVRRTQILLLQRQQQRLEAKQKQKQKKPHHHYQQQQQQLQQQQRQYHLQMQRQQQQQQQLQQQQQPSNHLLYNNNASNNHSTYDMQGNIRYHKLLKTSIENQQQIISLSNQIYNTNNDGYITFSDSVISSGKTPMYILPEFHPTLFCENFFELKTDNMQMYFLSLLFQNVLWIHISLLLKKKPKKNLQSSKMTR